MLTKLYCRALSAKTALKHRLHSEKGAVDMVVIIIMIAIVVGLAFIFRDQITGLVNKVFTGANDSIEDLSGGKISGN